jgi:hypothetical protein
MTEPTTDNDVKIARRKEAARKAAATRAQRRQQERVDQAVETSLDRVAASVAARANDPPGTPLAKDLIRSAQADGAEAELYRLAHLARAPWRPSQWSAETRIRLGQALAEHIRTRTAPKTKGTAK